MASASTSTEFAVRAAKETPVGSRTPSMLPLMAPSVIVLLLWMIVPLVMTLWFSFQYYNLLDPSKARLRRHRQLPLFWLPTRTSGSR